MGLRSIWFDIWFHFFIISKCFFSDNCSSAALGRKYFIKKLDEIAPIADKRFEGKVWSHGCSCSFVYALFDYFNKYGVPFDRDHYFRDKNVFVFAKYVFISVEVPCHAHGAALTEVHWFTMVEILSQFLSKLEVLMARRLGADNIAELWRNEAGETAIFKTPRGLRSVN